VDVLRRTLRQVQQYLGGMGASQKLLIGSVVVIMLMTLFLVSQYAGQSQLTPVLRNASAEEHAAAAQAMGGLNIPYKLVDGQPHVKPERAAFVYAQLAQANALPSDSSSTFDELVSLLSPWNSKSQNDVIILQSKQATLAQIIRNMTGVRDATVVIDKPDSMGLGRAHVKPTAAVSVSMEGGGSLNQKFANSIAHTVSGAVVGLEAENVRIVDANNGTRFVVRGDDYAGGTEYLEQKLNYERKVQEQLEAFFGFIAGVRIMVFVELDNSPSKRETVTYSPEGKGSVSLLTEEEKESSTHRGAAPGGEPGVNPNTALNVTGVGGSGGDTTAEESKRTKFDAAMGRDTVSTLDPGGKPMRTNVTIAIPKSYLVQIYRDSQNDPEAMPTDDELDAIKAVQFAEIEAQASATLTTSEDGTSRLGTVTVGMIPVMAAIGPGAPGFEAGAGGTMNAADSLLSSKLVKNSVLGGLALVSLALMFMMMRKASKPGELPTAEELVGIPPSLQMDEDMVGEADEASPALAGVELDEGEVRESRIVEQVTDLIKQKPDDVATLVNRWMSEEP
jgi:flagellar biosynthesis/type III secretory pathway M-ring protein FliF/YscJ